MYQSAWLLDQRPVHPVHLVVEAAGVAQVVAGAVATPQRGVDGAAVDALPAFRVEFCVGWYDWMKRINNEVYFQQVITRLPEIHGV